MSGRPDDLEPVREAFDEYGRQDPMYAALSAAGRDGGRWDPDAFFERGEQEIGAVLDYVRQRGFDVVRERALDFGCGAGRLTQALALHFRDVTGVDIASSMIAAAQ